MEYGRQETGVTDDDGSVISRVENMYRGEVANSFQHFYLRVKVEGSQGETAEYLKFTDKMRELRDKKQLYIDPDDKQTIPAFMILYPKKNIDNSYFVILNWCEYLVKSK
jgi:hypothetical protein